MDLDLTSNLLAVDTSLPWREVETWLGRQGRTLGFGPPLRPVQTLGELLSQGVPTLKGAAWGHPAELCVAVEATVSGRRERTPVVPRSAAGPDFKHLILGAGGAHATLHRAWLKVFPAPEVGLARRIFFPDVRGGVEALRAVTQRFLPPTVALLEREGAGMASLDLWWSPGSD